MERFILINNERNRIKVFEPFEDVSKPSPSIDAMMISYGCVYKRSSKPVMKGSRVETVEAARKEYEELLEQGGKRPVFLEFFLNFPIYVIIFINIFFPNPSKFS